MHDELWCPQGHEASDHRPAGPSSALCSRGTRFSTCPGVQAAYRSESGVDSTLAAAAQPIRPEPTAPPASGHRQGADDAPSALVPAAGAEPGPIVGSNARDWSDDEVNAPPQLPEGNEPEADPESKPGAESATIVEPPPPRPRDILDWLAQGPDA